MRSQGGQDAQSEPPPGIAAERQVMSAQAARRFGRKLTARPGDATLNPVPPAEEKPVVCRQDRCGQERDTPRVSPKASSMMMW